MKKERALLLQLSFFFHNGLPVRAYRVWVNRYVIDLV